VTFHAPADPRYEFKAFYAKVRDRGFILYPGKLTEVETFRVGCIGAIGPEEMQQAVHAIADRSRTSHRRHWQACAGNSVRVIGTAPAGGGRGR